VIDPEDEIFWRELRMAVQKVELRHGLKVEVTRGTRSAEVSYAPINKIQIVMREVQPKQPALLVP
jgi:hypothetical protein